jgi:hypothetical protein
VKALPSQYCRRLLDQFVDLRDDAVGATTRTMLSDGQILTSTDTTKFFKRELPIVLDNHPHGVWPSRVKSAVEMSLGNFIDPTHQGGHTHGGFFGDGEL